jgi:hypothetical protein
MSQEQENPTKKNNFTHYLQGPTIDALAVEVTDEQETEDTQEIDHKNELLNRIEELKVQYEKAHNEYELAKDALVASVLRGVSDERGLEKEYFQHSPKHSNKELESVINRIESSIKKTQEFTQRLKMLQQEEEKLEVESSEEKEEEEIADDQEELVEEEAQTPVGEESPRLEADSSQDSTVALDLEPEVASQEETLAENSNELEQKAGTEQTDEGTDTSKDLEKEQSALDGLYQAIEAYEQGKRDKEMSDEDKNKLGEAYTKALGTYLESKGLSVKDLVGEGALDKIQEMDGKLLLDVDSDTIELDTTLEISKLEDLQGSLEKGKNLNFIIKEENGEKTAYVLPPNSKYALLYAKVLAGDTETFEGEENLVQELRTKVETTQKESLKSTYTNILDRYDFVGCLKEELDKMLEQDQITLEMVEEKLRSASKITNGFGDDIQNSAKIFAHMGISDESTLLNDLSQRDVKVIAPESVEGEESGKTLPTESQAVAGGEDGEEVPEEEKAETEELPGALVKVETGGEIVLSGEGEKTSEGAEEIKGDIDFRIGKITELIRDKAHWGKEDFLSALKTHLDEIARLVGGEFIPYVEEGREGGILVFYEGDKRSSVEIKGYNEGTPDFLRQVCRPRAENMVTNDETVTPEAQEVLKLQGLKDLRRAYIKAEEELLRMRESKVGVLGQMSTWWEKNIKHQTDSLQALESKYQTAKGEYEAKFKEYLGEQVAKKQASEIHNMYMTEMQELRDTRKASIADFATSQAEERKKNGENFFGAIKNGFDKTWDNYKKLHWKKKLGLGAGMAVLGMINPFTAGAVGVARGGMRFKGMQEMALAGFERMNLKEIKSQVATIHEHLDKSKSNSGNIPLEQLEADRAFLEMLLRLDGLSEHEMKIDVTDLEGEFAQLSTQINEAKIRINEAKGDQKKELVNEMKTKQQRLKILERLKINQGHISDLKELDEVIWEVSKKQLASEVLDEVNSADEVDKEKLNTIQAEKYAELAQNLMITLSSLKEKEQEKWNEKRKKQNRRAMYAGVGGVLLPYGVKGVWEAGLDDVAGKGVHEVMEKLGYDVFPNGEAPAPEAPGGQTPLDNGLENVPDTGTQIPLDSGNGLDAMTDEEVWELGTQVPKNGVWNETLSQELAEKGIPVMESEFGGISELSGLGGSVNSILLKEFGGLGDRTVKDMAKAFNSERVLGVLEKYGFQGMDDGDVTFEELRQFFLEVQSSGGINGEIAAQRVIHNAIIDQMVLNDLAEVMPVDSGDMEAAQNFLQGFFEANPNYKIEGVTDQLGDKFWENGIDRNEMIRIMEGVRGQGAGAEHNFFEEMREYGQSLQSNSGGIGDKIKEFGSPDAQAATPPVELIPRIEVPELNPEIQLAQGGTIWNTVEEKLMAAKDITSWENVDQGEVMGVVNEYLTSDNGKQTLFDRAIETEAGRELLGEMGINKAADIDSLDTAYDVARTIGPGELEGLDDVLAEHLGETGREVVQNVREQIDGGVTPNPGVEVVPEAQSAPTPDVTSDPSPILEPTPSSEVFVEPAPQGEIPSPPEFTPSSPTPKPIEWGQPLPESPLVPDVVQKFTQITSVEDFNNYVSSLSPEVLQFNQGENLWSVVKRITSDLGFQDADVKNIIDSYIMTNEEGQQWIFDSLNRNEFILNPEDYVGVNTASTRQALVEANKWFVDNGFVLNSEGEELITLANGGNAEQAFADILKNKPQDFWRVLSKVMEADNSEPKGLLDQIRQKVLDVQQ